jgi:hypothetical protein
MSDDADTRNVALTGVMYENYNDSVLHLMADPMPRPRRETRRAPIVSYIADHYCDHPGLPTVAMRVNEMLDEGIDVTEPLVDLLFRNLDDDWLTQFRSRHQQARRERQQQLQRAGYVYFIRNGDRIKIGYSRKPAERAKALSLRESNILGVIESKPQFERVCHDMWADIRIGNTEWFAATEHLLEWIKTVAIKWHYRHASRTTDTSLDGYQRLAAALGLDTYAE